MKTFRSAYPLSILALVSAAACSAPAARPAAHAGVSAAPRRALAVAAPRAVPAIAASPDRVTEGARDTHAAAESAAPRVVKLALGGNASFALMSDGSLFQWGGGDGAEALALDGAPMHKMPTRVRGIERVTDVATSGIVACARTSEPATYCWGRDTAYEKPEHLAWADDATEISVSYKSLCAIIGGRADCGGSGGAQSMATAGTLFNSYACAIRTNATLGCWGLQIGNAWRYDCCGGSGGFRTLTHTGTEEVPGLRDVKRFRVSMTHACAIANGGALYCWGFGGGGQLGNGKYGPPYSELLPQRVNGLDDVEDVVVGESFTCAKRAGGKVACWGANIDGRLGVPVSATQMGLVPTEVPGLSSVAQIAAGDRHMCALKEDGAVLCWGWNALGQLGNGKYDAIGANVEPSRVIGLP